MTAEPKTLTAIAKAAHRAQRREDLRARREAIAAVVEPVRDEAALRAWTLWQRETAPLRESAAGLAEQVLKVPADAAQWVVRPTSDQTAHMSREGLEFTAYQTMNARTGTTLSLGVRLAGSTARLVNVDSLEALGAFLATNAPARKRRKVVSK